jgi:hypothetical protein
MHAEIRMIDVGIPFIEKINQQPHDWTLTLPFSLRNKMSFSEKIARTTSGIIESS